MGAILSYWLLATGYWLLALGISTYRSAARLTSTTAPAPQH